MSKQSNPVRYMKGIFDSFGVPLNHTMRREIIYDLDHEGVVLWRSKYGWLRVITGYTLFGFIYHEAPLRWASSKTGTLLHLNHPLPSSPVEKDFDEFEFEGIELIYLNRFQKWYLKHIAKINFAPTPSKHSEGSLDE